MPDSPIDVPTRATVSFIESHVPGGEAILEIGCGSGHVAAQLSKRGYTVVGVDSDQEALAQAQQRDVNVVSGSWPDVDVQRVNAVVFTRSLHHISPLPDAVAKVSDVLLPKGRVLVEDFAFDQASPEAISWFLTTVESRKGQALISHRATSFVAKLQQADDPVSAWHQDHDHELHTIAQMWKGIGEVFVIRDTQRVPYLYRYLVPVLPSSAKAAAFIKDVYNEESRLGGVGAFSLIGRRIVAEAP